MINWAISWFVGYVVPIGILIGGIGGLWISSGFLADAYSSRSWPSTQGLVIRSELGSESDSRRSEDRTHYWADVEFKYEVAEEQYQSTHVTLDGLRSGAQVGTGRDEAEEILSRYPVGEKVAVHYAPKRPWRAVLQPGISPNNFFVPIFSLILTFIGAGWLLAMLFSRPGESSEQWRDKERVCPECQHSFTSVQDKGQCPNCRHTFFASEVMMNSGGK